MSVKSWPRFFEYFPILSALLAYPTLADELTPPSPSIQLPPSPVSSAGPANATISDTAGDGAPPPGVLREIGQRQTELAILELDLKRAELQKKLRELEVPPAKPPQFLPAIAQPQTGATVLPSPLPDAISDSPFGPTVRRIHKVAGELVAQLLLPGGEIKNIRAGGGVGGLKIVQILPDTVYARKGEQPPFALPMASPRRAAGE